MLVRFSTHYYVISLNRQTTTLFEAFRDTLIDVRNGGFPIQASAASRPTNGLAGSADRTERLRAFLRIVDERFGHYYDLEPMIVVVTGEKELQAAFTSVTTRGTAVVGRVEGDFSTTSSRDLGKIVWPVVKEAMSGSRERALRALELAEDAEKICGLDKVSRRMNETVGATLLVEEDYHVRGSISVANGSAAISPSVDVRDEIDDVIDMLIEKVLGSGGNVVFVPSGSLSRLGRIVLLLREIEGVH
jgi:Bacterial archaeo-eukaryotic release factor family 3